MVYNLKKADAINVANYSEINLHCDNPNYDYYKRIFYQSDIRARKTKVYIGDESQWVVGYARDNDNRWNETNIGTWTRKRTTPFIVNGNMIDIETDLLRPRPNDYFITRYSCYEVEDHEGWYYAYRKKEAICGTAKCIRFESFAYLLLEQTITGYPDIVPIKEIGAELVGETWYNYYIGEDGVTKHYSQPLTGSIPDYSRWESSCMYYLSDPDIYPLTQQQVLQFVQREFAYNTNALDFVNNHSQFGGVFTDGISYSYCDRNPLVAYFLSGLQQQWTLTNYPNDIAPGIYTGNFPELAPPSSSYAYPTTRTHGLLFIPFISENEFNAAKSVNYDWDNTGVKTAVDGIDFKRYDETNL